MAGKKTKGRIVALLFFLNLHLNGDVGGGADGPQVEIWIKRLECRRAATGCFILGVGEVSVADRPIFRGGCPW